MSLIRQHALIVLSLLAALPCSGQSQNSDIHGVVADSTTREPIPYANIQIVGTSRGAAANSRGFYLIPDVPPGHHRVLATAVGYRPREDSIVIRERVPLTVDLLLVPAAVELGEVVVTGQGARPLHPPGPSLHRLEQRDLKAVPVTMQGDVIRSLLVLPGVVSTSDVSSRFYVRGGAGDQNLILLDGMRLYSPFHALGVYSVLDPDIIASTDVYTGAFPAAFGGKLSSVISLTTKEPRTDRPSAKAGINMLSSKLETQWPVFPGVQLLLSGRQSLFPETFSKITTIDRTFSFYDLLAKASAKVPGLNNVGFIAFFTGDDLHPKDFSEANYQWRNQLIGITSSGLSAERMYLAAVVYVSQYSASRTPQRGSDIPPTSASVVQPGLRIDATLFTSRPEDFCNFGFEFVFPQVTYNLVNSSGARRNYLTSISEVSGWFRYQMAIGSVQLETGVRTDFLNIEKMGWRGLEPRINACQNLWADWQVRLAFARTSQRLVTANNEDDLIPVFDAWIAIPDYLKPETADHYVAGIDGPITSILSGGVQVYSKQYSDLVLYNRQKITDRDPDFIGGSGTSWGLETLVRLSQSPLDVYLSYAFSNTSVTSLGFTYVPRFDVRHGINALVVVHPSQSLSFSLRWDFKSGYPFTQITGFYDRIPLRDPGFDPFENDRSLPYAILGPKNAARLPSYHRLDVSSSYRFKFFSAEGELEASVINIYSRQNIFYFDRETGRRVNMLPLLPSLTFTISL